MGKLLLREKGGMFMRITVLVAVAIVLGAGIAVLAVKSTLHSDMRSAHAGVASESTPSISMYDIQSSAKNVPQENVKNPF
jgi:hypothetical protein